MKKLRYNNRAYHIGINVLGNTTMSLQEDLLCECMVVSGRWVTATPPAIIDFAFISVTPGLTTTVVEGGSGFTAAVTATIGYGAPTVVVPMNMILPQSFNINLAEIVGFFDVRVIFIGRSVDIADFLL